MKSLYSANSQQPTANSQQPTANSQQPTANHNYVHEQRINILLTSSGRRSYLVKYFREALNGLGEVHASNSTNFSPAMQAADKSVVTPLIYSDEYIPFLLDYSVKNHISIIIPLFDIDIPVLAANRDKFESRGIRLLVSDEELVRTCNDKWETYNFLRKNGFPVVHTYLDIEEAEKELISGEMNYPVIIKPRWGMGSIGIYRANDSDELRVLHGKVRRDIEESYLRFESEADIEHSVLIQEMIRGQEYGADIIHDLNGNYRSEVIRRKLAMRSGETDSAEIAENEAIHETLKKLSRITRHIGNMDIDMFLSDSEVYILEMNARFGGGYPFGHAAGVNLPLAIVKWLQGDDVDDSLLHAKPGVAAQKDIAIMKMNVQEG